MLFYKLNYILIRAINTNKLYNNNLISLTYTQFKNVYFIYCFTQVTFLEFYRKYEYIYDYTLKKNHFLNDLQ